jgi:hypothetical protein
VPPVLLFFFIGIEQGCAHQSWRIRARACSLEAIPSGGCFLTAAGTQVKVSCHV